MTVFQNKLLDVANTNDATKNLITESHAEKYEALCSHMLEINKSLNLTARKDEDGVILQYGSFRQPGELWCPA